MSKEEEFWFWFQANNARFFFLNQIVNEAERERILKEFMNHLHAYNENLFFEIGGYPDEIQELIITAEGNAKYFHEVEHLVHSAPPIKDWTIIALKPPVKGGFTITYKDVHLKVEDLGFFPLENVRKPEELGLIVYLEYYDVQNEIDALTCVYLVLDALLGEKSAALDVHHVEINLLQLKPQDQELVDLIELPKYINWKKSKH